MPEEEQDTRQRIQAVALELFTTQGFETTSLREIAERLGVTKAALYYHFPSKADLIRSIVEPARYEIDALLEQHEVGGAADRRTVLGEYYDVMIRYQPVWMALTRDASGLRHVDLEGWILDWLQRFQNLFLGEQPRPADLVRIVVAIGGLARAAVWFGPSPEPAVREAALDAAVAAMG